jgi:hypothetical protein
MPAAAAAKGPLDELLDVLTATPEKERASAAEAAIATAPAWVPNPGPQTRAYFCEADELLFGGEAGGGKTDLLIGVAINEHERSLILRRINQDVPELGDRLLEIVGSNEGYSSHPPVWRRGSRIVQLRGCEQEKDKQRFKGRPRDFYGFDELADFLESQYVFITSWNRSTTPGQRCRVIGATNGPTTPEAQWIVRRWGAWLDPSHPNPAKDGELRWYISVDGQEREVDGPGPHVIEGKREPIRATSRTFIRSRLSDNPDLAKTDYGSRLEGITDENLRRVLRDGDFTVGLQEDAYQVIPTAWIEAAQQRWSEKPPRGQAMTAIGVDVASGGGDLTAIAFRYGGWFGPIDLKPGKETKEGHEVAAMVVRRRKDRCPVVVDVGGGWGGDAVIKLKDNGIDVIAFNGVAASMLRTPGGKVKYRNKRAESYWRFREALDPEQEGGSIVALPPDPLLKADLAAVRRKTLGVGGIQLERKDEIKARIGRSPDRGDAVVMCFAEGERAVARSSYRGAQNRQSKANVGHAAAKERFGR